jgi:hypothetical protein
MTGQDGQQKTYLGTNTVVERTITRCLIRGILWRRIGVLNFKGNIHSNFKNSQVLVLYTDIDSIPQGQAQQAR